MPHVKHVWCNDGKSDSQEGQVGHIVRSAYQDENGETKSDVFVNGDVLAMAYREPSDWDENGNGLCFWNIVVDAEGSNRS